MAIPVDGMYWRGWGTSQAGTSIVIPDGLSDARQCGTEHSQNSSCSHCRQAPLTWIRGREEGGCNAAGWTREGTQQYVGAGVTVGVKGPQARVGATQSWELIWDHLDS